MARLIAIETATEACSAALLWDGEVRERYQVAPQAHGTLILEMLEALIGEAGVELGQLDAVAFGRGPGAFTGVRIAVGVAQGAALGAGLPVVPVSSLAALAAGAGREAGYDRVLAGFDARMGEVYWAAYERDGAERWRPVIDECVSVPEQVPVPEDSGWLGAGSAFASYADRLRARLGSRLSSVLAGCYPRAADVARLAEATLAEGAAMAPESALPLYVRDEVVKRS